MSTRRGYLNNASPPALIEYPITERFGSGVRYVNIDVEMQLERGAREVYTQGTYRVWTLKFRFFTQAQYDFFKTLHEFAGGRGTPFYFVLDIDSPGTAVLVRKEKDFAPVPMEVPRRTSGAPALTWDYEQELTEVIDTPFSILA